MIRYFFCDMDGTLLNSKGQLSAKNLEAIKALQDHDIAFCVATGRNFESVREQLPSQIDVQGVFFNGSLYMNKDKEILAEYSLPCTTVEKIFDLLARYEIPYLLSAEDGIYTNWQPEKMKHYFFSLGGDHQQQPPEDMLPGLRQVSNEQDFLDPDQHIVYKIEAFRQNIDSWASFQKDLDTIAGISCLSSFENNTEITCSQAVKANMILEFARENHIHPDEIAVMGDGMNDYPSMLAFQYSFAPANARTPLKQAVWKVVDSCDDNGFAAAVKIILEENGRMNNSAADQKKGR